MDSEGIVSDSLEFQTAGFDKRIQFIMNPEGDVFGMEPDRYEMTQHLVKFDPGGSIAWQTAIEGGEMYHFAVTEDRVIATGIHRFIVDNPDGTRTAQNRGLTIGFDPVGGQELWRIPYVDCEFCELRAIAGTREGNILVAGWYSWGSEGIARPWMMMLDKDGKILWDSLVLWPTGALFTRPMRYRYFRESPEGIEVIIQSAFNYSLPRLNIHTLAIDKQGMIQNEHVWNQPWGTDYRCKALDFVDNGSDQLSILVDCAIIESGFKPPDAFVGHRWTWMLASR